MKLTKTQEKALRYIEKNPGMVTNARGEAARGKLTINGRTESSLYVKGLVELYNPETGLSYREENSGEDVRPWYSGAYAWRLTAAGEAAISRSFHEKLREELNKDFSL